MFRTLFPSVPPNCFLVCRDVKRFRATCSHREIYRTSSTHPKIECVHNFHWNWTHCIFTCYGKFVLYFLISKFESLVLPWFLFKILFVIYWLLAFIQVGLKFNLAMTEIMDLSVMYLRRFCRLICWAWPSDEFSIARVSRKRSQIRFLHIFDKLL